VCGVFGVYAAERDVARLTYFGLFSLQHRGQESAGIAVSEQGRLTALRDLGLVTQVFDEQKLHGLQGQIAIGHTRYSTTGSSQWSNAQPLVQHGTTRTVALGHNGNLVNETALRERLREAGVTLRATSDSEVIAALIANDEAPLEQAVANAMQQLEGAYSVVALSQGTLIAFRDAHGFRPLVLGRIKAGSGGGPAPPARPAGGGAGARPEGRAAFGDPGDDWVVASETCALDLVGATYVREVERGEAVLVDENGLRSIQAVDPVDGGALCIFEFFYLARPDTRLNGIEVHGARVRMGERLAAEAPADADLVLPIPDSGTPAAIGFSRALGIPFSEGLIKNRYIARTFIQPDQELRRQGVRLKFNPLAEVAGQRVVVVDDSIVRGNTTRQIVQMLFDAGAAEVHVRISSPPVIGQCFYGIDLADPAEMIAADKTIEQIREYIGATSLAYLSHEGLVDATKRPETELCRACLTREYPTAVPAQYAKLRFEAARA
jgi:amidophosphoribosyltransferase